LSRGAHGRVWGLRGTLRWGLAAITASGGLAAIIIVGGEGDAGGRPSRVAQNASVGPPSPSAVPTSRRFTTSAVAIAVSERAPRTERRLRLPLSVTTVGDGIVRSHTNRIECGSRCVARLPRRSNVLLRAFPGAKSSFLSWSGACRGTGFLCVISMERARRVRATFVPFRSVSVTVSGGGTIDSDPRGLICGVPAGLCITSFPINTQVVLRAKPEFGYELVGWFGPCASTQTMECQFLLSDSQRVSATFRRTEPPLVDSRLDVVVTRDEEVHPTTQVVSDPPGIRCPDICTSAFMRGTIVTLTPTRDAATWTDACTGLFAACRLVVDQTLRLRAHLQKRGGHFGGSVGAPSSYGLNITVSGRGTVTDGRLIRCGRSARSVKDCRGFFPRGETVVLRARPAEGARFLGWVGHCVGRTPRCKLRFSSAMVVSATFRP
jgi:List-Bact-rpt repeat protein